MYSFSHSKEVQFLYISLHKQLQLKVMTSMKTKYLKGLNGTYSQNWGQRNGGNKKKKGA